MTKKKNPQTKPVYKKKSKSTQLLIGLLILIFAGYMIYSNFIVTDKTVKRSEQKVGQSIFDFTREGDLTFTDAEGKYLTKIDIEIAEDEEARNTGLMYRAKMKEDQGMLFIFPAEKPQSFWMRNTILPLDIIFVNSKMEVVNIRDHAKPFDESSYSSTGPAKYVVEVNAGFADEHGIIPGSKIIWRRN